MQKTSFYSTNRKAPEVDLKEALLRGQAPDRGLYLPCEFPTIEPQSLESFPGKDYARVAFEVLRQYTPGVLTDEDLWAICQDAYDYEVPVEEVHDAVHVMRLDRGPTASFKDFAARWMARAMGHLIRQENRSLLILVATSGDTGSAVASAFNGVENIQVLVLFPFNEVSDRQRKQMTTLSGNVRTIALKGKFDDCQALVKQAFADEDLSRLPLSSANSINIGRLLPQSAYYFYAASRIAQPDQRVVITVPSGNFGNMMGAVIARTMGLPVHRLVVPVNANDEYPQFLETEHYHKIEPSRKCISNAMNVGHPSNLARLVSVYGGWLDERGTLHEAPDFDRMRRDMYSTSVSDERTRQAIRKAWQEHRLLLEPHGAVGWQGFLDYEQTGERQGLPAFVLETAHPAKFPEEIESLLNFTPETPASLARLDSLEEDYDELETRYESFKDYLTKNYG